MSRFPLLDAEIEALRQLSPEQLNEIGCTITTPRSTHIDGQTNIVDHERIRKLLRLAEYLSELPPEYENFDMHEYIAQAKGDRTAVVYHGGPIPCGAVACALGHAPAALGQEAGQFPRGYTPMQWTIYAENTFGDLDYAAYDWFFASRWADPDNTPEGAAARIVHLLACVRDNRSDPDFYVNLDDMYMARETDAYSELLAQEKQIC